ncbi:hypothetical protein BELL_1084g00030 [Botrytis elliptica]|uniref:Uncharacterized protein n=1 Tax=Botrytis elliptica TaxID=278938 RepID=A0A4Z1INR2_9HELO|nr:hypothetical protein EAE99_006079 [Botrytis elliptica]TGO63211.1 hypothetical protein BELL_1084g00030 [Botrytis elliptica]
MEMLTMRDLNVEKILLEKLQFPRLFKLQGFGKPERELLVKQKPKKRELADAETFVQAKHKSKLAAQVWVNLSHGNVRREYYHLFIHRLHARQYCQLLEEPEPDNYEYLGWYSEDHLPPFIRAVTKKDLQRARHWPFAKGSRPHRMRARVKPSWYWHFKYMEYV